MVISCNSDELKITTAGEGIPGKDCGKKVLKFCFNCNNYFHGIHNCMKRECPNCYSRWAWREAWPCMEKVLFNRRGRKIIHGVVSLEGCPQEILVFRKDIYAILRKHGVFAGIVIPHHKRKGKLDGYLHYHFLGYLGRDNRYIPGESGRYVFKVIRWCDGPADLVSTIHYFLTHCAIVNGRHAITYFGEKFTKPKQLQKKIDEWCPFCNHFSARTVPIIDSNGGYMVNIHTGCSVEGGG